jgi:ATP-dependent helicase/nuclease subunit B
LPSRVSAHLARWGVAADDSAGQKAVAYPAGYAHVLALARVAAEDFAPVPLLDLLKHPLVCKGEARIEWLEEVRRLDLILRGPRPAPGLGRAGSAACASA